VEYPAIVSRWAIAIHSPGRPAKREDTLEICARLKQTALLVTHDVEEAAFMGDRIVIFSPRPAHIADIFDNPLPPLERDVDDTRFIQFKKKLLQSVMRLVKEEV